MVAQGPGNKSIFRRQQEGVNVKEELIRLDGMIKQLKIEYEQHFLGILPHAPDQLHQETRRQIRLLARAPSKNSQMNFAFRTLQNRYNTYNSYWTRTNREREAGTYFRDVFRAELHQKLERQEAEANSAKGKARKGFQDLFNTYCSALEKQTGKKQQVDYDAFQKALVKRAKALQAKNGKQKLSFRVVVKDGKVAVEARAKQAPATKPVPSTAAAQKKVSREQRRTPVRRKASVA